MSFEKALTQTAHSYVEVGQELLQAGKLEGALSELWKALSYKADYFDAHILIAQTLARQHKWTDCSHQYKKVLDLNPGHLQSYVGLGDALRQEGKYQEAIQVCRKAERQGKVAPGIFRLLGNIMEERQHLPEAIRFYRQFLEYKPKFLQGYVFLARALNKVEQYAEANHYCDLAIKQKPDHVETIKIKAHALRHLNQAEQAITHYWKYLELRPNSPGLYIDLGELLLQQQRYDEVMDCCSRAKQQQRILPGIFRILGTACHKLGFLESSISNYQKFLDLKPEAAWVYVSLGNVLRQSQQYEEAITSFEEAAKRGHANQQMHRLINETIQQMEMLAH